MKYPFNISVKACLLVSLLVGFALPSVINAAVTGPVSLATQPLANSTTLFVKPNLMFIFDDSLSMNDDAIPDIAGTGAYSADYYFKNAAFNGMAYDAAVTYSPPGYFTAAGVLDTTTYPSQAGTSAATGQSGTPTPNWKAVKASAYVTGGATNIETGAYFYTVIPGEYCQELDYKRCVAATAESITYPFPARLRWCKDNTLATQLTPPTEASDGVANPQCQAANDTNHTFARYPSPRQTTITVAGSSNTSVNSIKPGGATGPQILSAATAASTSSATVASRIRDNINSCTRVVTGSCTVAGYAAIVDPGNSSRVIVVAPTNTAITAPTIGVAIGTMTFTTAAFTTAISGSSVPGKNLLTVISTGNTFGYPGSSTVSLDRTDCTSSCTYAQEMENYANWYTYYRVRLQAMETSVSRAFKNVDNRFRVGFSTINDATVADSTEFLVPKTFETANKKAWYDKLFSIDSSNLDGSTPNRFALAKIGNFYAKKVSGQTFDPIQYSCQQNFAILSTDGFWNKNGPEAGSFVPKKPDGTTIGDQDSGTSVPLKYRQGPAAASNSLADVAKFFYETDLRSAALSNCSSLSGTGETLCETTVPTPLAYDKYGNKLDKYSNVFKGGDDDNPSQHMTTFTMAFGLQDKLTYEPNYDNAIKGDFRRLKTGEAPTTQWTDPQSNSTATTITVPGRVDDLWHAAVSGRGKYFSAAKPEEVVSGFVDLLTSITTTLGAGAAAATSTLNPVAGDDSAYVASYTTGEWTGNLESRAINLTTGAVEATPRWCVEDVGTCIGKLTPQAVAGTRKIWTKGPNASTLNNFKISGGDLSSTDFDSTKLSGLSQWASMGGGKRSDAVANIVDYLRGKKDKEFNVSDSNDHLFRTRQATLGDAINSQPAFIGKSTFSYTDAGYSAYKTGTVSRAKTVYMGTNDGMMHAFDASATATEQGKERWAYVPSMVIPNMWKLADNNYAGNHAYFVDGSPVVSDVYYGGSWKTILVAGLNGGGKGYYALDVSNPDAPTLLWEFTPSSTGGQNLGYTYGKPVITKRSDGKWVVLVTSGYNNHTGSGDGKGYLYVIDSQPGAGGTANVLKAIATSVPGGAVPSGLAQITAWVDSAEKNNTATFIYGGDLLGNLWRFDIRAGLESAHKFASLSGQSVTTKPELGLVLSSDGSTHRVVFVGTGKYLETNDLTDNTQQTLYAIKDDDVLGSGSVTPELVNPRGSGATNGTVAGNDRMVVQTLSASAGNSRTVTSNNPVNFSQDRGWFIDLAVGERQNVASQLVLGTLIVPTTVPESSACRPGGKGWLNFFDYKTGRAVAGNTQVSTATNAPIVGINVIYIPDPANPGKTMPVGSAVTADDPTPKLQPIPFSGAGSGFQKKRVMWREVVKP